MATVALPDHSRPLEPLNDVEFPVESARDEYFSRPARGIFLGVVLSLGMWAGIFFLVTVAGH